MTYISLNSRQGDKPVVPEGQITPGEAAEILGVSRQRVDQFIREGLLAVVDTVGHQKIRLLDRAQVERFKREREKKARK